VDSWNIVVASKKLRSYSFLTISNSENARVGSMERMFLLNPFWMKKQSINQEDCPFKTLALATAKGV
jgi:hypothetical protein